MTLFGIQQLNIRWVTEGSFPGEQGCPRCCRGGEGHSGPNIRKRCIELAISTIQKYCMEQLGYENKIELEYLRITNKEEVTRVAQTTINIMCDKTRELICQNLDEAVFAQSCAKLYKLLIIVLLGD